MIDVIPETAPISKAPYWMALNIVVRFIFEFYEVKPRKNMKVQNLPKIRATIDPISKRSAFYARNLAIFP